MKRLNKIEMIVLMQFSRRDEFIGEASRWEDLIRWRACDQVNGYQIEGMKYWGTVYEGTWLDGTTNLAIVDVE